MNQYNQKNKPNGPEFEKELDFYVPVGAILVELKDCSDNSAAIGSKNLTNDEAYSRNHTIVAYVVGGRFPSEFDK